MWSRLVALRVFKFNYSSRLGVVHLGLYLVGPYVRNMHGSGKENRLHAVGFIFCYVDLGFIK